MGIHDDDMIDNIEEIDTAFVDFYGDFEDMVARRKDK